MAQIRRSRLVLGGASLAGAALAGSLWLAAPVWASSSPCPPTPPRGGTATKVSGSASALPSPPSGSPGTAIKVSGGQVPLPPSGPGTAIKVDGPASTLPSPPSGSGTAIVVSGCQPPNGGQPPTAPPGS